MKKYILSLISILVIILIPCKVFAVEVTDENLENAISGMINYKVTDKNGKTEDAGFLDSYSINTNTKKLSITSNSESYTMDYTLGENPTFSYSRDITSSYTYEEYAEQSDSFIWMLLYVAVANIQGIKYEDALAYSSDVVLNTIINNSYILSDSTVTIVPDDYQGDVTGNKIKESEYGQFLVNYIKNRFETSQILFQDNGSDLLDTFKVEIYATNPSDTSVTINYKLTIDTTKDYSQIEGQYDQSNHDLSDVDKELDNKTKPTILTQNGGQEIKVPDTANNIPKIIIISGLLITVIGTLFLIKYLNIKTIKVEE